MSVCLTIDESVPSEVSTNSGWGDFCRWCDSLDEGDCGTLIHLADHGWCEPLSDLKSELAAALKEEDIDPDVAAVGTTVLELLDDEPDDGAVVVGSGVGDGDKDDDDEEEEEDDDKAFPLPRESLAAGLGTKAVADHWRDKVEHYRKEISTVLTATLEGLGAKAVREIRRHRGGDAAGAVDHAVDVAKWTDAIKSAVEGTLTAATHAGAAGEWLMSVPKAAVGLEVKTGLPGRVVRVAGGIVAKLLSGATWGRLVRGLVKAVKGAVAHAVKRGRDAGDAAASILTEPLTLAAHADRTADVEAAAAVNGGRHAAFAVLLETGAVKARRWVTCRDSHVRDAHKAAHGQVARGDKPFMVGGEPCMYPGDPSLSAKNRCRCRCVSVSIRG